MPLIRSLDEAAPARGGVLSIGNFDGVHRGHQAMVSRLVAAAKAQDTHSVILTFDPHPIKLLAPAKAPPSLSTLERKAELLTTAGADFVIAAHTTRDLLGLEAIEFFERIVVDQLAAVGMVEGPNFHFGRGRGGDTTLLSQLCSQHNMSCEILAPVANDGIATDREQMISSSLIRAAIVDGRIADAVAWLGHPYQVCGRVTHGDARGRTLGFPTANLSGVETLLPPDGVYAARCEIDGHSFAAAVNIGGNPTFGVDDRKVEVHLIDFNGDLYDQVIAVDLIAQIRGLLTFDGRESLIDQLQRDIAAAREHVNGPG